VVKGTQFAEDNAELLAAMPGTTGPLGDLPGPADIAERSRSSPPTGPLSSPGKCSTWRAAFTCARDLA